MNTKIIFVHGFAASRLHWEDYIKTFSSFGFETHALDLLGHGDGTRPNQDDQYRIDVMFEDFQNQCDEIVKTDKLILIGHSLGCYLILKYVFHRPEKVDKIVLVSPLLSRDQVIAQSSILMKHPNFGSRMLKHTPLSMIKRIIQSDKINSEGLSSQMLYQTVLDYKRADPRIMFIGNDIMDISADLKQISRPVLVTWGDKDNTLDHSYFKVAVNQIPSSKSYVVNDGGHVIYLTHIHEVSNVIAKFITDSS